MKKFFISFTVLIVWCHLVSAQNCGRFIKTLNGKKLTYTNQNGKNEATGKMVFINITKDASTLAAHMELFDKTGKSTGSGDSEIICTGQFIKVDMRTFIPTSSLSQFGNLKMTGDSKYLTYPVDIKAGQKLDDGMLNLNVGSVNQEIGKVQLNIINRMVEKSEKIETSAGSYNCFKISNDIWLRIQMMGASIPFKIKIVEWFAPKLGRFAKSETFDKDGKLIATTLLTAIN